MYLRLGLLDVDDTPKYGVKTMSSEIRTNATFDEMPVNKCGHKNRTRWLDNYVGWIEKCLNCGREW